MNIKKVLTAVVTAANVVSITAGLILTAAGSSLVKAQQYDKAAERWAPDGGYTQLSCFLTEDSGFTSDATEGVKADLISDLKNISVTPEEGRELIPSAYSAYLGQITVRGENSGRAEAKVTAAGGDFFLFRGFKLINGAYFSDKDIMQDGVVIDRTLAWDLYGSENVAGMNIYISGVRFYVSGVIEDPSSKQEKKTAGDAPRAYISYKGAGSIGYSDEMGGTFKKVSCYECLVPDPVENYAYNAVKKYFDSSYSEKSFVVNNTERYKPSKRAKAHKKLADSVIVDKPIIYPFWENASRIVEFRLSGIYFYRRLTYIIPVLTMLFLIVLMWRAGTRLRRKLTSKTSDAITKVLYKRSQKKQRKRLEKEEAQKIRSKGEKL